MNIYDFDDTIFDGDASVEFYFFALRRKPWLLFLLPFQLFLMAGFFLNLGTKENQKEAYFLFTKFIPLKAWVLQFWEKKHKKIKHWYLAQKQDSDIIISASPEFLLKPVFERYLKGELIASKIDETTGKYIGKNCHGQEKVERLFFTHPGSEIEEFYSDSLSDTPLAENSKRSFIVRGEKLIPWKDYTPSLISKLKQTYFSKDFILFVFCGGTGTLVNFVFASLISIRIEPTLAYVLGYAISLFATYALNARLIFNDKLNLISFFKFLGSYIPNFLILFSFVAVFINIFFWNKILVYALAGLLGLPVTFILVKLFAFAKNTQQITKKENTNV
jgi:putative flippase GtrA